MLTIDGSPSPLPKLAGMRTYAKAPVPVTAVRQSEPFEVQVSWQDEPLAAQAGDWLVGDPGDQRPVAADIFASTYEHLEADQYVKVATVQAVQVLEPFKVLTLEGAAQAQAGDYLAQGAKGEAWPIPQATFEANYRPA